MVICVIWGNVHSRMSCTLFFSVISFSNDLLIIAIYQPHPDINPVILLHFDLNRCLDVTLCTYLCTNKLLEQDVNSIKSDL